MKLIFTKSLFIACFISICITSNAQLLPQYSSNSLKPTTKGWQGHVFSSVDWSSNSNKEKYGDLFVNYLTSLRGSSGEVIKANFETFLNLQHHNGGSLAFFYGQFEKYLYDPNSPLRSEYLYEAVLLKLKASPKLSKSYSTKINTQLNSINLNRPGSVASNFTYTTVSNKKGSLHGLKTKYILLHFSNSGCDACTEVFAGMKNSQVLMQKLASGQLTILTVDISKEDKKLQPNKTNWILALDPNEDIEGKGLYDLPAMPSLYLLDENKKVIIKDGALPYIESYLKGI